MKRRDKRRPSIFLSSLVAALMAGVAVAAGGAARANDTTLYIGYSPGGGYDTFGRLLAAHIGRHLPGTPNVIVRNMPGASSMVLANYLYSVAPRDGTAFGAVAPGIVTAALYKTQGVNYDARRFTWLGSMASEVALVVAWHQAGINSIQDVMERELIVGTANPGSGNHDYPTVLNAVVGTKFKLVPGYPGQTEIIVAMERGEVQGVASWNISGIFQSRPQWLPERRIVPLLQLAFAKHPTLPDVPLVLDLAKTDADRQVLELVFAQQAMVRPYIAPPAMPAERASALRGAFDAALKDPALRADAKKRRVEISGEMTGEDVLALVERLYATPQEVIDRAAQALAAGR